MAADENIDGKPQKRAMPDFVKDALKRDGDSSVCQALKASPARLPMETKPFALPFVSEGSRIVPDAVLRSALFEVIGKGKRKLLRAAPVAAVGDTKIFFTGEQLDQGDLDVWENVIYLHSKRGHELGSRIRVSGYELLKLMGLSINGKNRTILTERLARLVCSVTIKNKRYQYTGTLLTEILRDEETLEYMIGLNESIAIFFEPTRFSQIDWQIRQTLRGQQLAQWLHGFYATHAKPLPMKIETLHKLCGIDFLPALKSGDFCC